VAAGKIYLLEIDVQGALQLKELGVRASYVFVAPPRIGGPARAPRERGTDPPEVIERRLHKANDEMEERHRYDFVIVNDDLERAVAEVRRIAGLNGLRRT
jgi:guanylate kinase